MEALIKFAEMKYIPFKNIKDLQRGDIIRSKFNSESYVIDYTGPDFCIGVNIAHVTNPDEWEVLRNKK